MNWREMPFVRLIIPFALGILTAIFWQFIPIVLIQSVLIISGFGVLLLSIFKMPFRWRWLFGIPLSMMLFSGGYASVFYKNELNHEQHFEHLKLSAQASYIIGVIVDKTEKPHHQRLILSVKKMGTTVDSLHEVSGNLLIYLKKDTALSSTSSLQYGDLVILNTKIRDIEAPKNPYSIDFQQYWHFQNVHYQSFIDSTQLTLVAHNQGNPVIALAQRWQLYFISILKQYLGEGKEWVVASALLLGSKEAISEDIRNAYIESGAMHILAISGMHILLIFKLFERVLNLYKSGNRRWRWVKTIILIIIIALFTLVVGLGTSVLRAAVMASFVAVGQAMKRKVSIFNILAVSAFVLLLCNPYWLMDIGFQLSYAAVLGIALFTAKFKKLLAFKNNLLNYVWGNISIGLAAQLMVTPISVYYFHQFPTWFWLSGLLIGGVADAALIAGILFFIFNKIPLLGYVLSKILFGLLWIMNNLVFAIQKLPFSLIDGISLSVGFVILVYVTILGVTKALEKRALRLMYYPLSIILFLSANYAFRVLKDDSNRYIIVYHLPQNSLVNVTDGQKCYSFFKKFSKNFSLENKIKFASSNLHNTLRINNLNTFDFSEYYKNNSILYHNGYMQMDTLRVVILDKLPKKELTLSCHYIIIRESPRLNMRDLIQIFAFQQLIFDTSNKKWLVEKWKKECQELNINYYDIAESGAWVRKF